MITKTAISEINLTFKPGCNEIFQIVFQTLEIKLQTLGNLKPQLDKAKRKSFTRKPNKVVLESPKTNQVISKVGY